MPALSHIDTWLEALTIVLCVLFAGGLVSFLKTRGELQTLAKKSELDTLREVIAALQTDNTRLRQALHEVEDRYEKRIAELERLYRAQCDDYERRIDDLEAQIDAMAALLKANGITPPQPARKPTP